MAVRADEVRAVLRLHADTQSRLLRPELCPRRPGGHADRCGVLRNDRHVHLVDEGKVRVVEVGIACQREAGGLRVLRQHERPCADHVPAQVERAVALLRDAPHVSARSPTTSFSLRFRYPGLNWSSELYTCGPIELCGAFEVRTSRVGISECVRSFITPPRFARCVVSAGFVTNPALLGLLAEPA